MTHLAHVAATALYLFVALLGWSGRSARVNAWLLGVGVLVHTAGFWALHLETPPVQLESFPAALSLIGWGLALAYLLGLRLARVRSAAHWVAAVAGAVTLFAEVGLLLTAPAQQAGVIGSGAWSHAHVLVSTAGFSLLALASLSGLGYLAKERGLKRKTGFTLALPSLESLDRAEHWTLGSGFVLLTLGVVTGFAWGIGRGLSPWSVHSLFLLVAWGIYLLPVGTRIVSRQHGRKPARGVVLGFAFLAFSYIGIRLIGVGA